MMTAITKPFVEHIKFHIQSCTVQHRKQKTCALHQDMPKFFWKKAIKWFGRSKIAVLDFESEIAKNMDYSIFMVRLSDVAKRPIKCVISVSKRLNRINRKELSVS